MRFLGISPRKKNKRDLPNEFENHPICIFQVQKEKPGTELHPESWTQPTSEVQFL
jgi:hypothetical protein